MSQHICDQPISNTDATSFLRFRVQYPPAPDSHNQTLRPRLETESREITRPPHRSIGVPDADFRYWLQATEDVSPSGPQGLSGSIPEFFSNQQASVSSIPPAPHTRHHSPPALHQRLSEVYQLRGFLIIDFPPESVGKQSQVCFAN